MKILERERGRSSRRQLLNQGNNGVRDPKARIEGDRGLPREPLGASTKESGDLGSQWICGVGIEPEGVCDQPEGTITLELVGCAPQDLHPLGFRGFEFHVMLVISPPGHWFTFTPLLFLTAFTAPKGTWSIQSRFPRRRSAIIESEFV